VRADGDPRHRLPTELAHPGLPLVPAEVPLGRGGVLGGDVVSSWTVADPRTSSTLWGQVLPSIVRAAAG
jgi:hypothetical protein